MIIDTINISTFNLRFLKLEGYYDLPARKKILNAPGNQEKDIIFQSKDATFILMGKYTDVVSLLDNLNAFETLIKSQLNHDINLLGHGVSFRGVFDKGFDTTSFVGGRIIKLTVPITITE